MAYENGICPEILPEETLCLFAKFDLYEIDSLSKWVFPTASDIRGGSLVCHGLISIFI